MKQNPRKIKHKKNHKPSYSYASLLAKTSYPLHGNYVLKSLEAGKLTYRQIEAGRKTIRRQSRKKGYLAIRVFPYVSITKKPLATRMGKGKGNHAQWICPVRKGQIIYEVGGLSPNQSLLALANAGDKMPFKTKVFPSCY